jgi:hypothetical protein
MASGAIEPAKSRAASIERYSTRFAMAATCLITASGRSTLGPKILELLPHPVGGAFVFITAEDFISVAERRRRVVHAASKGIDPAVSMFDHPGLAVDEHIICIARDDTHLHPSRGEKIVQSSVALTGEEKIESILGRLPIGDERAGKRLLSVARGLGDLDVERIDIGVADDLDLSHSVERFADSSDERK